MKKIIRDTRHPALAIPLNPNIPAIIARTKSIIASGNKKLPIGPFYNDDILSHDNISTNIFLRNQRC